MRSLIPILCVLCWSALAAERPSIHQRQQAIVEGAKLAADNIGSEYANYINFTPARMLSGVEMRPYVAFGEGWYTDQEWGRWSQGYHSTVVLKPTPGRHARRLKIRTRYLGSAEATRVSINGVVVSEAPLNNLTIELSTELASAEALRIDFAHVAPLSPKDLDPSSTDTRRMKLGLMGIRLY